MHAGLNQVPGPALAIREFMYNLPKKKLFLVETLLTSYSEALDFLKAVTSVKNEARLYLIFNFIGRDTV
jgi:hypothetical protein